MLASGLAFVGVTGTVRHLGTALPAAEGAFLRFGFGLLFLLPVLVPALRTGYAPRVWRMFAARGALHTAAVILWFYAMARLTVADVTAISYLNPIGVTIGAALVFGERLALRRILAICVAIVGALVILRPGFRQIEPAHLAQLGAAAGFAVSYLITKRISGLAPASAVVATMSLTVTIGLAPIAALNWVPPAIVQLGWLV